MASFHCNFYVTTPFRLSKFCSVVNPIRDFFRGKEDPVRPHNSQLSRDLQMHNACRREMVQGEEWWEKRARRRKKRDMQAKVIRSSLQGSCEEVGEKDEERKREQTTRLLRIAVSRPWGPWFLRNQWPYKQRSPLRPFLLRFSVSAWYLLFAAKQLYRLHNALLSPIYSLSFNFHSDQC